MTHATTSPSWSSSSIQSAMSTPLTENDLRHGLLPGSMFTYEVACQLSTRFAAVASHAGTMPISPSDCAAPMPWACYIHGVQDEIIPSCRDLGLEAVGRGRHHAQCRRSAGLLARKSFHVQPLQMPGNNATHRTYANCANGARLEHYQVTNGGHECPTASTEKRLIMIWRF